MASGNQGFANIIARVVPFVFGLIGLTVIIFLWSIPFGEFGSPPLFFRIFGSLIASVFMLVGFGGAIFGLGNPSKVLRRPARFARGARSPESPKGGGYTCPNCSARLDEGADVSPRGDVKCTFCSKWFNIH